MPYLSTTDRWICSRPDQLSIRLDSFRKQRKEDAVDRVAGNKIRSTRAISAACELIKAL
jgi:hypothetical protein